MIRWKMFCGTRNEVRGNWRRLHNEELHDIYFSPEILVIHSRRMRWAGHVARTGVRRGAYSVFVERPEERRLLGKGRRRLEDNTKVELKEVRRGVDWIELAQDRDRWRAFVNVEMKLQVL
jgi:hypothetical protein